MAKNVHQLKENLDKYRLKKKKCLDPMALIGFDGRLSGQPPPVNSAG